MVERLGVVALAAALSFFGGASALAAPGISAHEMKAATAQKTRSQSAQHRKPGNVVGVVKPKPRVEVTAQTAPPDAQGRYLAVVRFKEESLAAYDGGRSALSVPARNARGRIDMNAQSTQAYLGFLEGRQADYLGRFRNELGREVRLERQYLNVLNAVAVRLTLEEANELNQLDYVRSVNLDEAYSVDTYAGPQWIGAPAIWNGENSAELEYKGEEMLIGIIDSGFNFAHPSFSDVAPDGYDFAAANPIGAGNVLGACLTTHPTYCNDKVIGAYSFHAVADPQDNPDPEFGGHGTHTGSTAGGNAIDAVYQGMTVAISGVAPHAHLISYKVCHSGTDCLQSSSVSAVNQAIADGVDVINFSISGSPNPYTDIVDQAFLDATAVGVYVSASAGNSGPGAGTTAHNGPWNAAVANSSHDGALTAQLDAAGVTGVAHLPATVVPITTPISATLIDAADVAPANVQGCDAFAANAFNGAWALIQRGTCSFVIKVNNAAAAGAAGVIVYNNVSGPMVNMALDGTTIPAVFIRFEDGQAISTALLPAGGPLAIGLDLAPIHDPAFGDVLNTTSSRGPTQFDILKPDFAAPGTNILAGVTAAGGNFDQYSGTSMAAPHAAGAAALLKGLNPTWSPAAIKSAIALTAHPVMRKENGVTPSDPFDRGSGRVNLLHAGSIGAVMDETAANFEASDPGNSGDPRTLNMPYVIDDRCIGTCSFTRTLTSVSAEDVEYSVSIAQPAAGVQVAVSPSSFTLEAGTTEVLTISVTIDDDVIAPGAWNFGSINLQATSTTSVNAVNETFNDATFPPTGWSRFVQAGATSFQWARTTASSASAPASAFRRWDDSGDQDDWLVSPAVAMPIGAQLSFNQRVEWPADYDRHTVLVSTGSCVPADGDFVEVAEPGVNANAAAFVARSYSLASVSGQTACIAFRYEGNNASSWYVDDVVVSGFAEGDTPALRLPVIIRAQFPPTEIDVTPASVSEALMQGASANVPVEVSNLGGDPLNWSVVADAVPTGGSRPGVGENAVLHASRVTRVDSLRPDPESVNSLNAYSRFEGGKEQAPVLNGDVQPSVILPGTGPAITHSLSFDSTNMLGCPAPTSNYRVFTLADFGITTDFPVTSVDFGIGQLTAATEYTVILHTWNPATPFVRANFTEIGRATQSYAQNLQWTTVSIPVLGTVPAGGTLVVETTGANNARGGSNLAGSVGGAPSFISGCGLTEPTAYSAVPDGAGGNFGHLHVVMRVHADINIDCGASGYADWATLAPASGTVARETTQDAVLTLDATGLDAGTYETNLCIGSNDADEPIVVVPLELEVQPGPDLEVTPAAIDLRLNTGDTDSAQLTLASIGEVALASWSIDEASGEARQTESYRYGRAGAGVLSSAVGTDRANGRSRPGSGASREIQAAPQLFGIDSLSEAFDDIAALPGAGWAFTNNSEGATPGYNWFQGNPAAFPAQAGATNAYAGANFEAGSGTTLSVWMMTPEVTLENGTELRFWSRAATQTWPDRMEVRLSTQGGSTNVGSTPTSVGDFTSTMLVINPTLTGVGYPQVWTEYVVTVSGLSAPTTGRFAFRYFVEGVSESGNGNYIGVDTVSITQPPPTGCDAPSDVAWLSASPTASSGPLAPGASDTVTVGVDATTLTTGVYEAQLCINSDAGRGRIEVPVTLTVGDDPSITVDPTEITASVPFGGASTQTLTIGNDGDFDLDWSLFESEVERGGYTGTTLFDQMDDLDPALFGALATWDTDDAPNWVYQLADDFTVPAGRIWTLDRVKADGFYPADIGPGPVPPGNLDVYVYADDNGKPAGTSYDDPAAGALFVWQGLTATEDDAGAFTIDLPTPAEFTEGTYWISVQPRMDFFTDGLWAWFYAIPPAPEAGAQWHYQSGPENSPCQTWSDPLDCDFSSTSMQPGLAFSLHGADSAMPACAAAEDIPWLNVPVNSGTVIGRSSSDIDVQINASGLATGTHEAVLCITSNDAANPLIEVPVSVTVSTPAVDVLPDTLGNGTVGVPYSATITATGDDTTPPFSFAVTDGALPDGLTLAANGEISGTPTAAGTFGFTVTATDSTAAGLGGPFTGTQAYSVEIALGTQTISFAPLPDRNLGETFNLKATASSGLTVSFSTTTTAVCQVSGAQVTTVGVGVCTITASQAGDSNYLAADDVTQSFDVVDPEITIAPGALPSAVLDVAYSVTLTASGDSATPPFTFTLDSGTLPPGITLASDGTLSGTPTTVGEYDFVIEATDSTPSGAGGPFSGTQAYTIEVLDLPIFADGFEDEPAGRIELSSFEAKVASVDLVDTLAALGDGEHLVATLTVQGKRVGYVQARCGASCEVRVLSLKGDANWQAGPWMLVDSDPFELPLEAGARYIK